MSVTIAHFDDTRDLDQDVRQVRLVLDQAGEWSVIQPVEPEGWVSDEEIVGY